MGKNSSEEKTVEDTIAALAKAKAEKPRGAKLEMPSEPEKPKQEELDAKCEVIDKEVEAIKAELDKISGEINKRGEGKEEYNAAKKVLQDDFDKSKDVFDRLRDELYALTDQSKANREAGKNANQELRGLEKDIKNMDEATVDQKLKALEFKMHTASHSLAVEKTLMKEIAELKKRRPEIKAKAAKLAALKGKMEKEGESSAPLEEQIQEKKKQIEDAKGDKDAKNAKIRELRDARQAKAGNVKEFIDKKDELRSQMKEKKDKKWELTTDFRDVLKKHRDWERKCKDMKWQEQKVREDAEWEAWEAQKNKAKLEKAAEKPYFEEMTLLEQTINYCKNLTGDDKKEEAAEKKDIDLSSLGGGDGAMLLVSKKDREAEMFQAGRKGKALKQKNKDGASKKGKNIKHNAGTFALFAQIKVKAPMTLDDVPEVKLQLEAQMEVYNKKIAQWEIKRKDIEAEILAADEKVKAANEAAGIKSGESETTEAP